MAAINLDISFFTETDGNSMSLDLRIAEAVSMIENPEDYLVIEDQICTGENELRSLLMSREIL